jgi:CO/xanthine dehydrogenase FAD-binding subunit
MVRAFRPLSLHEALDIRNSRETIVFAGGTDLMVRHRSWGGVPPHFDRPALMIGHLAELREIRLVDAVLEIGACCTLAQIINNHEVPEYVKLPLAGMASPSIRAIATIGGNIGNASPAGDTLPMLYALDARLTLKSRERRTVVNIMDFITGPGKTMLRDDEIIIAIRIPLAEYNRVYCRKVGARRANSISKLSLYAAANIVDSRVHDIRISFGSVAPTVVRSREAEALLKTISPERISGRLEEVKDRYAPLISPIDDMRSGKEYRRRVAFRLLERCLLGWDTGL